MKFPSKSEMSERAWINVPRFAQASVKGYLAHIRPGIKDLYYHWDKHLTPEGRYRVMKGAGL